jgi:hypothetical protein
MANPATGRIYDYERNEMLELNFNVTPSSTAFPLVSISNIERRPMDIRSRMSIRAQQEIWAEEDKHIFEAINACLTDDIKNEAEMVNLRKSRIIINPIFELEILNDC